MEHLLDEFDDHESLKPPDPPASESDTGSKTFITSRNYLAEKGLLPAPKKAHQRRLYVVSSPKPVSSSHNPTNSLTVKLKRSITPDFVQTKEIHPTSTPKFFVPETVNVDKHFSLKRVHRERRPVGPLHRTTHQPKAMSFTVNESIMPGTLARLQEKEQLQLINDRFSAYVQRVRLLSEQSNHIDSSAFLQNAQILEDEITSLKNLYEKELDAMR